MSASEISSEVCAMESCEEEQTDGLSSDIGGFLSSSCMETDVKSDPFTSDHTLGFPEDSTRFDSECILNSTLAEGVSMQQAAAGDSSVSSLILGDSSGSCSVLTGGSFFMYDFPPSSLHKPINPVMQHASSNIVLVGGTDVKGAGTDQKFNLLPPVQLLSPTVVAQPPSHPIIIGNSSAASFVKSVIKDATVLPSLPPSTMTSAKETVNMPPVMLLNTTLLPPLSVLQSAAGLSSSPLLIQLPGGIGVTCNQDAYQAASCMNNVISQCGTMVTTSAALPAAATSVSIENMSAECPVVMTSSGGHNPSSNELPISSVCSPLLTSVSTPADIVPASSPSFHDATCACSGKESCSISNIKNINTSTSGSTVPNVNLCDPCIPEATQNQIPRSPLHPIVISCMKPDDKGNKGMRQILEHFLQQNKVNDPLGTMNMDSRQALNANIVDLGTASASTSGNADIKPQIISVSDFDGGCNPSLFSVPSLGRKSSSVVFILKRTDSQTSGQSASYMPSNQTLGSSIGLGDKSTTALNTSCLNIKQDEIDGSVTPAVSSSSVTGLEYSDRVKSESAPSVSKESVVEPCASESNDTQSAAVMTDSGGSANAQYQWVQIQVPHTLVEERKATENENSNMIQKLIPLTVNEKLESDLCHPIIICIVQEDGLMKKVNINPVEIRRDVEMKGGSPKKENVDTATVSDVLGANCTASDTSDIECVSRPPAAKAHTPPTQPSSTMTSPGHSSQGSTSPQTSGSENGLPPALPKPSPKTAKDKQFKCDLCTAVFSRLGNYTRHRKIHTLNLKEDMHFKCPYCDRLFLQRCDMNRHIAIHTKEYPFRCQTCDKGYIRKSDLVVHERFHSKNRAFKCETCGRSFYQSGDLNRHKRFVHMEQSQLSCGHCHRKYASEVTLLRHIKAAHSDILLQSVSQHTQQQ